MSDYHINIFYSDEDAAYVADIPDLDACSAVGQSPEEALTEVEKAKSSTTRQREASASGHPSTPAGQVTTGRK